MKLLGHMVALLLVFWGTSTLFDIVTAPTHIPTNRVWGFPFFHILANICCVLFDDSHSNRCEVIAHCGFDLHFPDDLMIWCWESFHIPAGHLYVFFEGMYIQVLCPFFKFDCFLFFCFFANEFYEFLIYFGKMFMFLKKRSNSAFGLCFC